VYNLIYNPAKTTVVDGFNEGGNVYKATVDHPFQPINENLPASEQSSADLDPF
jgi:hypothetical protein